MLVFGPELSSLTPAVFRIQIESTSFEGVFNSLDTNFVAPGIYPLPPWGLCPLL